MTGVAIVTGGTRGIGRAISVALKDRGYQVIASYVGNKEKAEAFCKETKIPIYQWDVSCFHACREAFSKIEKDYGPVSILVNNAGITRDTFLHKMSFEMWNDVLQTNLTSCFNTVRCVIDGMRKRGFGRIINISSINGLKGQIGQVNYSAAKAGIIGFTKALALETASKGITVNVIAPGYINTDMVQTISPEILQKIIAQVPAGRLGTAEEVARAVVFLADKDSGYITGATFNLNGGQYLA